MNDALRCGGKISSRFTLKLVLKIHENRCQIEPNGSQRGPWGVLGTFRGLKVTQERPRAPQKGPQEGSRAPLGTPRGAPRATRNPQRAPRGSPRAILGGLGRGKIYKKSVTEAKKVHFSKSAPRIGRGESRSTFAKMDFFRLGD